LALQLGHCHSIDFDWFAPYELDPDALARTLERLGIGLADARKSEGMLHARVSQVRVSVLEYRYRLLEPLVFLGIKTAHALLAAPMDIARRRSAGSQPADSRPAGSQPGVSLPRDPSPRVENPRYVRGATHEREIHGPDHRRGVVLHTLYTSDREFKREIHLTMRAAFGDELEELVFPPAANQRIQLGIRWRSLKRDQAAADLSDGTLRYLYLITALADPNPPSLIAIDEPETGLHPGMLPMVAEYAVEASRKSQVILTTHSPQFLSAFRDTQPTVTVSQYENGETRLAMLDGDSLSDWLQEYSLGTLFTTVRQVRTDA